MKPSAPTREALAPEPEPGTSRRGSGLYALFAVTIFAAAFLLFVVQPTVARMVLPWFGGSAAVWTVAMLFFQVLLLLGYLYAHAVQRLSRNAFLALHLPLLSLSVLSLPLLPAEHWKPAGGEDPTLRLLALLAATVGLPYFLLSTTGPLMQARVHAAGLGGSASKGGPYRLYALSNLGSMLALLSYPLVVEPGLTTRMQGWGWSAGYVSFVLLSGVVLVLSSRAAPVTGPPPEGAPPDEGRLPERTVAGESPQRRSEKRRARTRAASPASPPEGEAGGPITWLLLSATAVTLLLGVTNQLCQDVAAVPFLWVLPLALYLATFILCFDARGWYRRGLFLALLPVAIAAMGYALIPEKLGQKGLMGVLAAGLFVCCMVCHGELHRLRPHPARLTGFYLAISAGGAAGGLFAALLAPRLFSEYDELPLGLAFLGALVLATLRRDPSSRFHRARLQPAWLLAVAGLLVFSFLVLYRMQAVRESSRVMERSFYGILRVRDRWNGHSTVRTMFHGMTNHGEQVLEPGRGRVPTTYYGAATGVGRALEIVLSPGAEPRHVGVIGLGTGTLAVYGRPGDRFRFYEINPLVVEVARREFTFLADARAEVAVVTADARLALEHEEPQSFDVLAVDAFSGDSIPVHLLTLEAFALYERHLAPGGVLAVHVSNRFLDLPPVVALAARSRGLEARLFRSEGGPDASAAAWMLLSREPGLFDDPRLRDVAEPVVPRAALRAWTDDYSNLLRIIK